MSAPSPSSAAGSPRNTFTTNSKTSTSTTAAGGASRVTLDSSEAAMFRRIAAQQVEQDQRNKQVAYNNTQLRWLFNTNDYKDYNCFKKQTDHFKAGYWFALLAIAALLYLDTMSFLVQPVDRYQYYNNAKRSDSPIIGTLMRSSGSLYIAVGFALLSALFILPWTLYSVWSPCDENPQEANFISIALTHIRAYFVLQVVAPYLQIRLDVPPFLSNLKAELNSIGDASKQLQQQGLFGLISNSPAIMRTLCAIGVPLLVGYLMFYRPFAKFWKKKALVHQPLFLYAPQFGFALLFAWWFVSTSATSKSVDSTISFLYNEVFTRQTLSAFIMSNTNTNNNQQQQRNNATTTTMIMDFCCRLYGVVIPYCVVMLSIVSFNHLIPSLESMSDLLEIIINHHATSIILHLVFAFILNANNMLTSELMFIMIVSTAFIMTRAEQRKAAAAADA